MAAGQAPCGRDGTNRSRILHGMVAASLIMWYFEHVVKYKGVEEELNEVEDKVDRVMEMAEENKARIEAVQQNVDSMRLEILEALRNIQLDIAAR